MTGPNQKIADKLRAATVRELLFFGLPTLLALALVVWVMVKYVRPAPPDTIVLTSGAPGGTYEVLAKKYEAILARSGVTLIIKPSSGAAENLARLKDTAAGVDAAFIQGGILPRVREDLGADAEDGPMVALASLYYEPVWVFYRHAPNAKADKLADLKGKRIGIAREGSGTRAVALNLLGASALNAQNTTLTDDGGRPGLAKLAAGEVDAIIAVAGAESPFMREAMALDASRDDISLMSFSHADALTRKFTYLNKVTLARGVFDLAKDIPAQDIDMVAATTNLVIRSDLHPALAYLLLEAIVEVHGDAGIFHQAGEFPNTRFVDLPVSSEAKRYFKSGRPFLQRYLPFWLANLVERLAVMLIPVLAVLFPLFKFAPALWSWRMRARIYRWYGELKFIEQDMGKPLDDGQRAAIITRLDEIEKETDGLPLPLAFVDRAYVLKQHIALVREKLRAAASA